MPDTLKEPRYLGIPRLPTVGVIWLRYEPSDGAGVLPSGGKD